MAETRNFHHLRRHDRAKDDAWIRRFLELAPWGVLATKADGRIFLNPNLFVLDPRARRLYLHTARTGRTPSNVAMGGSATFSASAMGRLLPAPEALEFSVEYSGVIAFGRITPVEEEEEKLRALELIMAKYAPHLEAGQDYRPITRDELKRTGVHRLDVEAWSGKEKAEAPDFPGAYALPSVVPPLGDGRNGKPEVPGPSPAPSDLRIVPMDRRHWGAVREIYAQGIATGHATFETEVPDWEGWDGGHFPFARLVALDGDEVVGWAALSPVSGRCVYGGVAEVSVYVAEDRRGKGVGRGLLRTLVEAAEEGGIWTLQAGIFPENEGSVRLHLKEGFREVGIRERLGKLHGRWRDVLLLERRSP
jgi:L-amino acid N-acyltransferase YncA/nitroimidazol reductase NimA-like FMN-containing flavoprotein (pyridoxamine 5'-phosphate oxidase superfamily)